MSDRHVESCGCVTIRDGWFTRVSQCAAHRPAMTEPEKRCGWCGCRIPVQRLPSDFCRTECVNRADEAQAAKWRWDNLHPTVERP